MVRAGRRLAGRMLGMVRERPKANGIPKLWKGTSQIQHKEDFKDRGNKNTVGCQM